jgi:tetratricopeptide (TPR) repeat protein
MMREAKELAREAVAAASQFESLLESDSLRRIESVTRLRAWFLQAHRLLADCLADVPAEPENGNGTAATTRASDWLEAQRIYEATLAKQKILMGPKHENTLTTMANLAVLLTRLNRAREASSLEQEVVEGYSALESRGPNHKTTLVARMNYGSSLGRIGRYKEACSEFRAAAEGLSRDQGPMHAQTLMAQYNLSLMLHRLGERDEALQIMQVVVQRRARIFGTEDPRTRQSSDQLERLSASSR